MRIWDLPPERLCRNHLLGEHRELHAVWAILTGGKKGYACHPEVNRWRGKLKALFLRHEKLVREVEAKGYHHRSQLDSSLASGREAQDELVDTIPEQKRILRAKQCGCDAGK